MLPSLEFDSQQGKISVTIVNRGAPFIRIKNLYFEIGYENYFEMSLIDNAGKRLLLSLFERGLNPENKTIFPREEDALIAFNGANIELRLESDKPFKILLNYEAVL